METERNKLIIFTRYPEPGKTKTRLTHTLGAQGAARLQARMLKEILSIAKDFSKKRDVLLEVHFEGGSKTSMAKIYGDDITYKPQFEGDLGERMAWSFKESYEEGASKTAIIGSDIPSITSDLLAEAFDALSGNDLVIGPAADGGYYLIGLKVPEPELFRDICWGNSSVLQQTLRKAKKLNFSCHLLTPLRDIDTAEDLDILNREETPANLQDSNTISVIIPTLNEENHIERCLKPLVHRSSVEIIVVDGGSKDDTIKIAKTVGVTTAITRPRKASQMNLGAKLAGGEILLFLHADTVLPESFGKIITETVKTKDFIAGAFKFKIDSESWGLRLIEKTTNFRSKYLKIPYGDQGIFLFKETFFKFGGFPDITVMEDFELMRRLRPHGKIVTLSTPAITSERRWKSLGIFKTTLINQVMILGYYGGIATERLAEWYGRQKVFK